MNPKLKPFIEVDDNGDRGIVADADIEEGQQLMLIPLSCCLHMPTQQEWTASQVCCWLQFTQMQQQIMCDMRDDAVGGLRRCCCVSQDKPRKPESLPVYSLTASV